MKNIIKKIKSIEFSQVLGIQVIIFILGVIVLISTGTGNSIFQGIGLINNQEDSETRLQQSYRQDKIDAFAENPEDFYYEQNGKIVILDDVLTLDDIKRIDESNDDINFDYNNLSISRPASVVRDERAKEAQEQYDDRRLLHDLEF